ncbi:MAG: TIGR03067 domain-containing protein [Planctomycetaceae bacterium]
MRCIWLLVFSVCCLGCGDTQSSDSAAVPAESKTVVDDHAADAGSGSVETEPVDKPADSPQTPATDEGKSDMGVVNQLQGKWVIVEANMSGAIIEAMNGGTAEITGNEIVVSSGGQKMKSTMAFEAGTDPVQFESTAENGMKSPAILKFEGDELTVCASMVPGESPDTFEPGAGRMVIRYKRQE